MVTALTALQLALLFLGTIALKGMVNANPHGTSSVYFQFLVEIGCGFSLFP
jgi:hypothetical protein